LRGACIACRFSLWPTVLGSSSGRLVEPTKLTTVATSDSVLAEIEVRIEVPAVQE